MKYFSIVAIVAMLLSATPVVAQSASSKQFRAYSGETEYFEFNDTRCDGQILNDGLICVLNLPEDRRPETRSAALTLFYERALSTFTTIRVSEIDTNEANIAYLIIIRDYVGGTKSDVPRLRAVIKTDGSVSIDTAYGEYPPQFSAEEESRSLLKSHEGEIRKLISALAQTR